MLPLAQAWVGKRTRFAIMITPLQTLYKQESPKSYPKQTSLYFFSEWEKIV